MGLFSSEPETIGTTIEDEASTPTIDKDRYMQILVGCLSCSDRWGDEEELIQLADAVWTELVNTHPEFCV